MRAYLLRAILLANAAKKSKPVCLDQAGFSNQINRLSAREIEKICRFYLGQSSRTGALNDLTHTIGADTLRAICQPALIIHSREDKSVPFTHAEWSLSHIRQAALCEAGLTGHFFWVGPDYEPVCRRLVAFRGADNRQSRPLPSEEK